LIPLAPVWYFICHYETRESRATMDAMIPSRRFWPVFAMVWLVLSLSQGCARSEPHPNNPGSNNPGSNNPGSNNLGSNNPGSLAGEQKLPFHPESDQASAVEGSHPAVSPDPKATSALPFVPHQRVLPSGTLLTVQLEDTLSAAKVHAGDVFTASVAAPLAIDGDRLIERGAVATGQIESVRAHSGSGYFQLRLNTITVEGRPVALQTLSLFARATLQKTDGVGVRSGHRLTFRLTSPVTLSEPKSVADRQSPGPTTE
jgi:hypothetical protein